MKKKHLIYIVSVMTVSMLGLIVLQFYWITKTLVVQKEQFEHDAHSMLNEVVKKLEKYEATYLVKNNLDINTNADDFFKIEYDSASKSARWQEQQTIRNRQLYSSEELSEDGMAFEIEEEVIISKSGVARKRDTDSYLSSELGRGIHLNASSLLEIDTSIIRAKPPEMYGEILQKKIDMFKIVLSELAASIEKKPLEERFSQALLDSLLKSEAQRVGIKAKYEYGVWQRAQASSAGNLLYVSNPSNIFHIMRSEFSTRLFPADMFDNNNMLYLHFPNKDAYIIGKMSVVLIASVIFIVLIILSFSYAVHTIIRQKKISEITKDFISNMTHELKTPIATVRLACDVLKDPDMRSIAGQQERYVEIISQENNRLSLQVERVLQIARMDRGDFSLKIDRVDIHNLIVKAIKNIGLQIESRKGEIKTKLQANNTIIEADEVHILSAISNLLDNANKYSPKSPEITIQTENNKHGVILSVSDKGIGITKDMSQKIFDKFYRVPTGNLHDVKGFGLGLSYVKTIVDAHHGSIRLNSEINKGSTFSIYLPFKNGSES